MIDLDKLCAALGAQAAEVRNWVEAGWVQPAGAAEAYQFADADVARVRLIVELKYELRIEDDTLPLVLSLLDQIYGLRRQLTSLAGAVRQQPEEVRRAIAGAIASPE
jgi:chaperone modulatory protein CbpM